MPGTGSAFRILPEIAGSRPANVTKSISAETSAEVRQYLVRKGLTILGENSRRHVIARGPDTFHKSLTPDSARRLGDFYPRLERAAITTGFVPRLIAMERINDRVSVASFEYVYGRGGSPSDTRDCLFLYAALQESTAQHSDKAAQALTETCRREVATWTEDLLLSWDPVNWTDPKILQWAGADADAMTQVGIPTLRSVAGLLAGFSLDGVCAPVHADLYVGNYFRMPTGQAVLFDWDEGYWGLPGMGLQILLQEAMADGMTDLGFAAVLKLAPQWAGMGLTEHDLAMRTLAGAVVEIAGIRQSLRELGRTPERHAAYLAAWACRYRWVITNFH